MANSQLSQQDVQDLLTIRRQMKPNDPRLTKLDAVLAKNVTPMQLEQNMGAGALRPPVPAGLQGMEQHPYADAALNTATSAVSGAYTGAMHTLYKTGELADRYLDPKDYAKRQQYLKNNPQAQARVNATINPTQDEKPAYYGEQTAEFFAPDAIIGDIGKASMIGRMLRAGATTGLVGSMQTGSFKQGAMQGALAAGSEPVAALASYGLRQAGEGLLNSALNISGSKLRRVNPAQYLVDNGGFNFLRTADGMREVAEDEASRAYNQISSRAAANPRMVDLNPTFNKGKEFMDQWGREQQLGLQAQGNAIMNIPAEVTLPNPVSYPGSPNYLTVSRNPQLPVEGALDVRRGLGKIKTWNANNFFEPPAVSMRDAMYGTLSDSLYSAAPELKQPMEAYSNYATIADSIHRKSSLWPSLMAGGFTGLGGVMHGGGVEGAITGLGGVAAYHAGTSAPAGYMLGKAGKFLPQAMPFFRNAAFAGMNSNPSDTQMLPNPFAPRQ